MNPFSYAIDYDAEIAQDRALLADCDRSDALCAMLPGLVEYTLHYDAHASSFCLSDFFGYCADLDFAEKVAAVAGLTLEELAHATDHDYNVDDAWNLWRAFEAKYGHAPRGPRSAKDITRICACDSVMTPAVSKRVRKAAKAALARHIRNKAKHA